MMSLILSLVYVAADVSSIGGTGLYADVTAKTLASHVIEYEPRFPLTTLGSKKRRFVLLPEGQAVDAANTELWSFPVGTKIWKEFRAGGKLVETRYMEKRTDQWVFGTFVWNEDASDAVLWSGDELTDKGIPSFDQCLTCHVQHDANAAFQPDPVLGFSAVQLDKYVIEGLVTAGRLTQPSINWNAHAIPAADARERKVIGYLHGNCGHCHNARRSEFVPAVGGDAFALDYNVASVASRADINLIKLISRPVAGHAVHIPQVSEPLVIAPTKVKESMLFYRMSGATGPYVMPMLGAPNKDAAFINDTLKPWIKQLSEDD